MEDKTVARTIITATRTMTPRQWAKARTAMDMTKEEILEDGDALAAVLAWHKEGADLSKFEQYLDKPVQELEAICFGQEYVDDMNRQIDEALSETDVQ